MDEVRACVEKLVKEDSHLELSPMMCNVLIKPLPREKITGVLYSHRYHLQTAGLICPAGRRAELTEILLRSGLVRVTRASDMSDYFPGESHDGEYALSRYTRIVNIEEQAIL